MSYKLSIGKQVLEAAEFRGLTELSGNLQFLGTSEFSLLNATHVSASVVSGSDLVSGDLILGASGYANWGSTAGGDGYGFRDSGGTLQFKNSGGTWANVGAGTAVLSADNTFGANSGHLHQMTGSLAVSGTALTTPALYVASSNFRVGVGTNTPTHDLDVNGETRFRGGVIMSRRTKTTAYTLAADDYIIGVGSGSTGITLTLPDASTLTAGQTFVIKDEHGHAATNNITISASTNGQTIDGELTIKLDVNRASINIYTNGTNSYFIY